MARYADITNVENWLHRDVWGTPDERWRPESEFGAMIDALPKFEIHENKITYDQFVCEICGSTQPGAVAVEDLRAMYIAYLDDEATE